MREVRCCEPSDHPSRCGPCDLQLQRMRPRTKDDVTHRASDMANSHGRFVWYGLMPTDVAAAKAFYTKVVGWGAQDASTPDMPYILFTVGMDSVCGLMELPEDARRMGVTARWMGYVAGDDVDTTAERTEHYDGAGIVQAPDVPRISGVLVFA